MCFHHHCQSKLCPVSDEPVGFEAADHHEKSLYFHCSSTTRHVKNRKTLQGVTGHTILKKHIWTTFQQQFQYSLTIRVFGNINKFHTTAILQVYHFEQQIFYITNHNWNLRVLSVAVHVHVINQQRKQAAITDHLKIKYGQSQTAWNFSPDYKSLGRKLLTPSDGGSQPAARREINLLCECSEASVNFVMNSMIISDNWCLIIMLVLFCFVFCFLFFSEYS